MHELSQMGAIGDAEDLTVEQYLCSHDPLLEETRDKIDTCLPEELGFLLGYEDELSESQSERVAAVLTQLKFSEKRRKLKCCDLSGGWSIRVRLAVALLSNSELLLLDEPTTSLDVEAIQLLEEELLQLMNRGEDAEMIIVAISHNRSFLEEICSDTILYQDQKLTQYPVPFVEFWKLIDEKKRRDKTRFEVQAKREAKLKNEIAKLQSSASKVNGFLFSLLISFCV
jgi:ATP-binding cassette subfamily F protein 3